MLNLCVAVPLQLKCGYFLSSLRKYSSTDILYETIESMRKML